MNSRRTGCLSCRGAAISLAMVMLTGCYQRTAVERVTRNYNEALSNTLDSVVAAREFNYLYPDSHNYYSYYTGQFGDPVLNCGVLLYGRYTLELKVSDIQFDRSRRRVLKHGSPEFWLNEMKTITTLPDGRFYITY